MEKLTFSIVKVQSLINTFYLKEFSLVFYLLEQEAFV